MQELSRPRRTLLSDAQIIRHPATHVTLSLFPHTRKMVDSRGIVIKRGEEEEEK